MLTAFLYWLGAMIVINVLGLVGKNLRENGKTAAIRKTGTMWASTFAVIELLLFVLFVLALVYLGGVYFLEAI